MRGEGSRILLYAAGALALALVLAGSSPGQSRRRRNPFLDRTLAARATLKPNGWLELKPARPLKAERDTQEVTLYPDPPIQMASETGFAPADGKGFPEIEAELTDADGATYRSRPGREEHMTGDLKVYARSLVFKDLPRGASFVKVRVRSSAAYPVKKIIWRSYNWAEAYH
jgi:hypothetical protein